MLSQLTNKEFLIDNPKIVTDLSEIWVGDPGSGSRGQKTLDPGYGSATLKNIMFVSFKLFLFFTVSR
jgi:hypothetical protein